LLGPGTNSLDDLAVTITSTGPNIVLERSAVESNLTRAPQSDSGFEDAMTFFSTGAAKASAILGCSRYGDESISRLKVHYGYLLISP